MSEREYESRLQSLKPFITLFLVVIGSALLASCGGGSDDPTRAVKSDSTVSDDPTKQALGVSVGTVPGTWKGRVPVVSVSDGIPSKTEFIALVGLTQKKLYIQQQNVVSYYNWHPLPHEYT